jgi:hypothetical protein
VSARAATYTDGMAEITDLIFTQYKEAAGLGAVVELRMRLLASRTPALEKYAHDPNLESLEDKIHAHFDKNFSDEERAYLKRARGLRNKILHSDFKAAANIAQQFRGAEAQGPGVVAVKVNSGETTAVAEMSKRDAGVFGWLLECMQTGVFAEAIDIFEKAIDLRIINPIYKAKKLIGA